MSYIAAVADWIEMAPEMPAPLALYRATARLDTVGCIVAINFGLRQRKQREAELQRWVDDGGRV